MASHYTDTTVRSSKRWLFGVLLLIPAAVAITAWGLYRVAFDEERAMLRDVARSQAALIEAVARFDRRAAAARTNPAYAGGPRAATIGQVKDALQNYEGLGSSGELLLARPAAGRIRLLHPAGNDATGLFRGPDLAMRSAGSAVGRDRKGNRVLAAFAHVAELDLFLIAKKDLAEIRAPFLYAGGFGLLATGSIALLAFGLMRRGMIPVFERLGEFERITRALAESAPAAVYRAADEPSRPLRFVNDSIRRVLAADPAQLLGRPLDDWIREPDRREARAAVQSALARGVPFDVSYRLRDANGTSRWVAEHGAPVAENRGTSLVGLLFDITPMKELEHAHERLVSIVEASHDFIGICTPDGRPVFLNNAGRRLLCIAEAAPLPENLRIWSLHPAWASDRIAREAMPVARDRGWWQGETAILGADGAEVPVSQMVQAHYDPDGELAYYSTIVRDLSEQKRLQAEAERERAAFEHLVKSASTGVLVVDDEGTVLLANPAMEQLLGRDAAELAGMPIGIPLTGEGTEEVELLRADGEMRTTEMSVTRAQWRGRDASLCMVHDVTERRLAEAQLEHLAYHDALTGLPNRRAFVGAVAAAVRRAPDRESGATLAVLGLDVDRFKAVNDALGHESGDELLCRVAELLGDAVRDTDVLARVGGDEFAILLSPVSSADAAAALAEGFRQQLEAEVTVAGQSLVPACSIGVALFPADARDGESLLRCADTAMYAAKSRGRNTVARYAPDQDAWADELATRAKLRHAVDNDEFYLVYQPQLEMASGACIGCEALLRWCERERGTVSPGEFIPLLEDTGLIEDVGDWVLREAMRQATEWAAPGERDGFHITVNLSPRQIARTDIVARVRAALADTGADPAAIGLEITETSAVTHLGHTAAALAHLRRMGVTIYLDDFGKGYSSLNYLHRLPVDVVKIDKEFTQATTASADGAALARAIVRMSHALGMRVLAEGIETPEQAAFLKREGCELAQGFFYGRPADAGAFHAQWGAGESSGKES